MSGFYKYISGVILGYLRQIVLVRGERYSIQLDKDNEVTELYETLRNIASEEMLEVGEFMYDPDHTGDRYPTYFIVINSIRLLVAATKTGITEDFLTHLRNNVDKSNTVFENTAILFIHNTNLDSLLGGSKRLETEGMPLHVKSIECNLITHINDSSLSDVDKAILNIIINSEDTNVYEETNSIFDFEYIFDVLGTGSIVDTKYHDFGMFKDDKISTFKNTKESQALNQRIKDNMDIYALVDEIHKYADLSDLNKHFDDAGVKKLNDPLEWQNEQYDNVKKSNENFKNISQPVYKAAELKKLNPNYRIWDRPEGLSSAKQRKRNIVIFNPNFEDHISIRIKFDRPIVREEVNKSYGKPIITYERNSMEVQFDGCKSDCIAAKITYYNLSFSIIIINVNEDFFANYMDCFVVYIKSKDKILKHSIQILDDERLIVLNNGADIEQEINLTQEIQKIETNGMEKVIIDKDEMGENQSDITYIQLDINDYILPITLVNEKEISRPITALDVWDMKRILSSSFKYEKVIEPSSEKETIRLTIENNTFYPRGEFRRLLDYEIMFINDESDSFIICNDNYCGVKLDISDAMRAAINELKKYFRNNNLIPSLTFMDNEYMCLATDLVKLYFESIANVNTPELFTTNKANDLGKVGVVYETGGENRILFHPLHPIQLAYQLNFSKLIKDEAITKELIKRINTNFLVPFLRGEDRQIYKSIENELVEWTTYVLNDNVKYNSTNKYVHKIVASKISDFQTHFDYLFLGSQSPIKIGIVNLGECKEILQGVFEYYTNELKNKKIAELRPLELHIYNKNDIVNAFEEIAYHENIEDIKQTFGVRLATKKYSEEDVIDIYREKVHFYKKSSDLFEYNHITFYSMDDAVEVGRKSMDDIETGILLKGILNSVTSVFINNEYVTGFGSKNLSKTQYQFIDQLKIYNSFMGKRYDLTSYDTDTVIVTAIKESESKLLSKIYEKSYWITFIDPKVDLNYFKNNEVDNDLMIIHYSDQYSDSNGFDAITVTQKSKMYIRIIDEFLRKEVGIGAEVSINIKDIINSFNAFNGEWLLRLVARHYKNDRDQFAREKLSMFAAVKFFEAYTKNSGAFFVPISLEEIVRVSGGSGLSKSDTPFNPKKLGQYGPISDDILVLGIYLGKQIKIKIYPVEVKIGQNNSGVIEKAKAQVKNTFDLFHHNSIINPDDYNAKLYRNILIQAAIMQVKKIKLYKLWDGCEWDELLSENVMNRLLNDDFVISEIPINRINDCAIMTFTKDTFSRQHSIIGQDGLKIDYFNYPLHDAYQYLGVSLDDIIIINAWNFINYIKPEIDSNCINENIGLKEYETSVDEVASATEKLVDEKNTPEENLSISQVSCQNENTVSNKEKIEINFGLDVVKGKDVIWQPCFTDKVMHTNTGIIGTMGTGKTQFTKSLITQIVRQNKNNIDGLPIGILIFDYKGDYIKDDFMKATSAKKYELYHLPFNPLSLYFGQNPKPMLPLHTSNELRDTISNAFNLGPVQRSTLSQVLVDSYNSVGIIKNEPLTWTMNAPTINTIYHTYVDGGNPNGDSLYAALKELYEFEIFEPDPSKTRPLLELIDGVTIINLAGYSESIQNMVVAITLDTFYAQMQTRGHSKIEGKYRQITNMILVDEADNFLSKNFNSIKKILKEGREFGVGTILSTQFLKHFSTSENEYAQYVLTWVIHKVNEISNKEIGGIFNCQNKNEQEALVNTVKNLEKHHSLVNLGGDNDVKHIQDKAFWELITKEN